MTENSKVITLDKFHKSLHKDINSSPLSNTKKRWNQSKHRYIKSST